MRRLRFAGWLVASVASVVSTSVIEACGTTGATGVDRGVESDGSGPPADAGTDALPDAPDGSLMIALGPAMQVLQPGDLGLDSVPDDQVSVLRQPDGSHHLWLGGTVSKSNGATAILSTIDFLKLTPVVANDAGDAAPIFGASAPLPCADGVPGSAAFDAQYAAPGTVLPAGSGTDLLMVYHAENHSFGGSCYKTLPFYATIGLARSTDGGRSWSRAGAILGGRDPQPATAPSLMGGWGAAVPTVLRDGAYFYAFYSDYAVPGTGHSTNNPIMVARAPASSDGAPGTWQKWSAGAFATPGLGGDSTPIVPIAGSACVFPRQPGVSYNVHAKKFILTMVCGAGWFFSTSDDLTTQLWTTPVQFFVAPSDNQSLQPGDEYDWHFALVSPTQPAGTSTDQSGYVIYSRGGFPNTPIHMMWRRTFTLTP